MNNIIKDIEIKHSTPSIEDYLNLRKISGLGEKSIEAAEKGLKNSLYSVIIYHKDLLIGMGRVIGDGGCFFQVVDIAVTPNFQGNGIGKIIMREIMNYLETSVPKGGYVSLIADDPANNLYEKFGFKYTYPRSYGMYIYY
ncbi:MULTISPECIES: GNAT family N-acetyltransferase [unclassified Clostridium]|uniref:GNAT family N-acetyltransferase n=1 Tax=unclassified Clostridium TaxID=2614128 RepID=UPI0025C5EEDE|nr:MULTISPECIES: GNAT family N-acetyltransferase [unclassified Clostridium]